MNNEDWSVFCVLIALQLISSGSLGSDSKDNSLDRPLCGRFELFLNNDSFVSHVFSAALG